MAHETSIMSYHEIVNSGFMKEVMLKVYDIIHFSNVPLSQSDVWRIYCNLHRPTTLTTTGARHRQLCDRGAIEEMVKRKRDPCTSKLVQQYVPTYTIHAPDPMIIQQRKWRDAREVMERAARKIVDLGGEPGQCELPL